MTIICHITTYRAVVGTGKNWRWQFCLFLQDGSADGKEFVGNSITLASIIENDSNRASDA